MGFRAKATPGSFMTQGATTDPLSLLFLSNLTQTAFAHTLGSSPASPGGWIPQAPQTSVLTPSQCPEMLCRTRTRSTGPAAAFGYLFVFDFKTMGIPMAFNTASSPGLQLQTKNQSP